MSDHHIRLDNIVVKFDHLGNDLNLHSKLSARITINNVTFSRTEAASATNDSEKYMWRWSAILTVPPREPRFSIDVVVDADNRTIMSLPFSSTELLAVSNNKETSIIKAMLSFNFSCKISVPTQAEPFTRTAMTIIALYFHPKSIFLFFLWLFRNIILLTKSGISLVHRNSSVADDAYPRRISRLMEEISQLTSTDLIRKADLLNDLGGVYWQLYLSSRLLEDLNHAINALEESTALVSDDHPRKAAYLNDLGAALLRRYEQQGKKEDLNRSKSLFEDAVKFSAEDDSDRPLRLSNLGNSLSHLFKHTGEIAVITESIRVHEESLQLTPDGHTHKPARISNLANAFGYLFDRLGDLENLNKSISLLQNAVRLETDVTNKTIYLNNLGTMLFRRFQRLGDVSDLDDAIRIREDVIRLTEDRNPGKPGRLSNLANSYLSRFERIGNVDDFDKSIAILREAIQLTPSDHTDMPSRLNNLANSLIRRFERLNDPADLKMAMENLDRAVQITPDLHPERAARLTTLSGALARQFQHFGDVNDINKAVVFQEEAIQLTLDRDPKRSLRLNTLGTILFRRFERLGDLSDIDRSIAMSEEAAQTCPARHPNKPTYLNSLGNALLARFDRLGSIPDINRSISIFGYSIRLTPDNQPDKPSRYNNLASSLWARFRRLGDIKDINESIQALENSLQKTPDTHPDRPARLSNLGNSLTRRYRRFGAAADIERSIVLKKEAVDLLDEKHHLKPIISASLANSLFRRFEKQGDQVDIDQSIILHEDALRLTPVEHLDYSSRLSNLGNSLSSRFERFGTLSDLDRSINLQIEAVNLALEANPNKLIYWNNLGNGCLRRFHLNKNEDDLKMAALHFSLAARSPTGPAVIRFRACARWAECTQILQPGSSDVVEVYRHAIDLLPQLAWLGLSVTDRFHHLMEAGRVVREAAAAAIQIGNHDLAVEWLEQGRSVIWGQLLQLRTPVDDLRQVDPALADRLAQVSSQLEGTADDQSFASASGDSNASPELSARPYHSLALEWEELVTRIRTIKGFKTFLLPPSLPQISSITRLPGPVVILNISAARCDALVIMPSDDCGVVHVSLPEFSLDGAQKLHRSFRSILKAVGRSIEDEAHLERKSIPYTPLNTRTDPEAEFGRILSVLWEQVVKPVLTTLKFEMISEPEHLPRIWWCPTGPLSFLPIHAAGIYKPGTLSGSKISDFAASSYTPTLATLLKNLAATFSERTSILAIAQPSALGQAALPGTVEEIKQIRRNVKGPTNFKELVGPDATVEQVSEGMRIATCVHFACHGTQDLLNPTKSALLLAGNADASRLTLGEIIKLSLPNAELAFLSACQTATGDEDLAEEAVHLAAGMLLAGYKGVIATMWSIKDRDAPLVADAVYSHLLRGPRIDPTQAARALHLAIDKLRHGAGSESFFSWVPYVHIGI